MSLLVTYQGRKVRRRRRTAQGLLLFLHTQPGLAAEQKVVSDADWKQYGKEEFQQPVRASAAK